MFNIKKTKGFTLIELLVVIAIIGTLASVVLASLSAAQVKARDVSRTAQIKQIKTALELYYNDNTQYIIQCASYIYQRTELTPHIVELPTDPTYNGTGSEYRYCGAANVNSNGPGYGIRIRYEDTNRPGTDTNGYCKTGVNMNPGWWGLSTPTCQGV